LFVVEVYPAPKEVKVIISRITLERRKRFIGVAATPPLLLLISREHIEIWIFGDVFVEQLNPNPKGSDWNQNIGGGQE
jgi:hypothetical protein